MFDTVKADTGAAVVTVRGIIQTCMEIGTGANTLIALANRTIENIDPEDHGGQDFAQSVDLLAKEIRRRADHVYNFLDARAQVRPGRHGSAGEHFEAVKGTLVKCMEAWKSYNEAEGDDDNEQAKAFAAASRAAKTAIEDKKSGLNPNSVAVAMAKLIIAKGPLINGYLKGETLCSRLEAEAAAAGLEWFCLRELYNRYFPGKAEESGGRAMTSLDLERKAAQIADGFLDAELDGDADVKKWLVKNIAAALEEARQAGYKEAMRKRF